MNERVCRRSCWALSCDIGFSVSAASLGLALLLATGRHLFSYGASDGSPVAVRAVDDSAPVLTAVAPPARLARVRAPIVASRRSPARPVTRRPAAPPLVRHSAAPVLVRHSAAQPLVRRIAAQPQRRAIAPPLVLRPAVVARSMPRQKARFARTRPHRRSSIVEPPLGYDPLPSLVAIPATASLDPAGLEPVPQLRSGRRH